MGREGHTKENQISFLSTSSTYVRLKANLHLGPVCLDVAQCVHPVPHVLWGLGEEINGLLLLSGGVEGNDGEATIQMMLLWNTTEDDLCYIHDLCKREVRREGEK